MSEVRKDSVIIEPRAEFFSVIRTTLRGKRVEIWMRDGESPDEALIYPVLWGSPDPLSWKLTTDEICALEDVLTAP